MNGASSPSEILDFAQTEELVAQMKAGNKSARDQLINANMRLVWFFAKKYYARNPKLELEDIVQEGSLGLIVAVDKYNPKYKVKLNTYAGYWIRWYMERYVKEQSSSIRMPTGAVDTYGKIHQAQNDFADSNGRLPSVSELQTLTGLSEKEIKKILRMKKFTKSLDDTIAGGDREEKCALEDVLADDKDSLLQLQNKIEEQDEIFRLLSWLDPIEKFVIIRMYGIGCPEEPLADIVKELELSRPRVKEIRDTAIKKLYDILRKSGVTVETA